MTDEQPARVPTETIQADEFAERVVALFVKGGAMRVPHRPRDRQIMLKSAALTLRPDRDYSEFEIDQALTEWLAVVAPKIETDHVTLRRMLVDEGFLNRDHAGVGYRLGTARRAALFASGIDQLDVWTIIDEARRGITERRKAAQADEAS